VVAVSLGREIPDLCVKQILLILNVSLQAFIVYSFLHSRKIPLLANVTVNDTHGM
jgi:hypothetical protein